MAVVGLRKFHPLQLELPARLWNGFGPKKSRRNLDPDRVSGRAFATMRDSQDRLVSGVSHCRRFFERDVGLSSRTDEKRRGC